MDLLTWRISTQTRILPCFLGLRSLAMPMTLGLLSSRLLQVSRHVLTILQGVSEREMELCGVIVR